MKEINLEVFCQGKYGEVLCMTIRCRLKAQCSLLSHYHEINSEIFYKMASFGNGIHFHSTHRIKHLSILLVFT